MRKRDGILALTIVVLLVGLVAWTALSVSSSRSDAPQPRQAAKQVQYTPAPDGWMISKIIVSASNVTGGYDTHPNIYGHLMIVDSQARTIVDSDWSRTNDWFGSYNQQFDNFTFPNVIRRALDPSGIGNTTALLASGGQIEITIQSGTFQNKEAATLPIEPQYAWCQDYVTTFSSAPPPPTSILTVRTANFSIQIFLTGAGHCDVL